MKSLIFIKGSPYLNELLDEQPNHGLAHHHLHVQFLKQVLRKLVVLSGGLLNLTADNIKVDVAGIRSGFFQKLLLLLLQKPEILSQLIAPVDCLFAALDQLKQILP